MSTQIRRSFPLLIASFVSASGWVLCLIRYMLDTFAQTRDLSDFIPLHWPEINPENEVRVYLLSIVLIPLLGITLYWLLQRFFDRYQTAAVQSFSYLFLKGTLVLLVSVYCLLWLRRLPVVPLVLSGYTLASFFLVGWCLFFPSRYAKVVTAMDRLSNWAISCLLALLSLFFSYLVFADDRFLTGTIVPIFKESSYIYLIGISRLHVAILTGVLFCILFLPIKIPPFLIRIFTYAKRLYVMDIVLCIVIVCVTSTVVFKLSNLNQMIVPNYNPVTGPVNDVLGGKTLLVNIHSQYGLLMIYFLSLLFRIIPLSYTAFFWVNYASLLVGYLLLYGILRRLVGIGGAVVGMLLIIGHFHFTYPYDLVLFSQSTFLRWGGWIVLLAFLLFKQKYQEISNSKFPNFLYCVELVLVGIVTFWGFDVGIYTCMAYLGYVVIQAWLQSDTLTETIKRLGTSLLAIGVVLVVFVGLISGLTYVRAGVLPNWSAYGGTALQFAGGWYLAPMPAIGFHPVLLIVYFYLIALLLYEMGTTSQQEKRPMSWVRMVPFLTFITAYGLFQFLYYVGRSMIGSLHFVAIPFFLLVSWLLVHKVGEGKKHNALIFPGAYLFCIVVAVFVAAGNENAWMAFRQRGTLSVSFDVLDTESPYAESIAAINTHLAGTHRPNRRVAIISQWDGYFLMKTQSVNVVHSNNSDYFQRISQLDELINQLFDQNPSVVFSDHIVYFGHIQHLQDRLKERYYPVRTVGFLDEWVKK